LDKPDSCCRSSRRRHTRQRNRRRLVYTLAWSAPAGLGGSRDWCRRRFRADRTRPLVRGKRGPTAGRHRSGTGRRQCIAHQGRSRSPPGGRRTRSDVSHQRTRSCCQSKYLRRRKRLHSLGGTCECSGETGEPGSCRLSPCKRHGRHSRHFSHRKQPTSLRICRCKFGSRHRRHLQHRTRHSWRGTAFALALYEIQLGKS
jgi:hypothetical protein